MSSLAALAGRGEAGGFRQDARFAAHSPAPVEPHCASQSEAEPEDPVALAFADGFAAGIESARAEAVAQVQADAEAHAALGLSLSRLDAGMAEGLRQRLIDTVMALCEATLTPFALDPAALVVRVERAVAMLSRADDDRIIRLHPDDLKLVAGRLDKDWAVQPDPALARGHLRVETATGGVEDGPAQWRVALAEAFEAC